MLKNNHQVPCGQLQMHFLKQDAAQPAGCSQYLTFTTHKGENSLIWGIPYQSVRKLPMAGLLLMVANKNIYIFPWYMQSYLALYNPQNKMRSKEMNQWIYLLASDTDNPQRAPAALSWRPGEAFAQDCARATWIHHTKLNLQYMYGGTSYHIEDTIDHQKKSIKIIKPRNKSTIVAA